MADGADFLPTLSVILTVVGTTGTMSWWLASRFKEVTNLVYNKTEQLQNNFFHKIDEHEAKDDKRFEDLNDDLWLVRVRLAAHDINGEPKKRKTKNGSV